MIPSHQALEDCGQALLVPAPLVFLGLYNTDLNPDALSLPIVDEYNSIIGLGFELHIQDADSHHCHDSRGRQVHGIAI
jgi:hypothetical protein